MDTATTIALALAGLVVSPGVTQITKQYIPVAWRATYALGISIVFAVVAEAVTGGFHNTTAAVAIPAVIGVAQAVYAIIGKVVDGTTAASAAAKTPEEPTKTV